MVEPGDNLYPHGGDATAPPPPPKKKSEIIKELRAEVELLRTNADADKSWYRAYQRDVPGLRKRLKEAGRGGAVDPPGLATAAQAVLDQAHIYNATPEAVTWAIPAEVLEGVRLALYGEEVVDGR